MYSHLLFHCQDDFQSNIFFFFFAFYVSEEYVEQTTKCLPIYRYRRETLINLGRQKSLLQFQNKDQKFLRSLSSTKLVSQLKILQKTLRTTTATAYDEIRIS